jgi:hypothetical protein
MQLRNIIEQTPASSTLYSYAHEEHPFQSCSLSEKPLKWRFSRYSWGFAPTAMSLHRQGLKGSQSLHNLRTFHLGEVPLHLKKKNAKPKQNAQLGTEESSSSVVAQLDEDEVVQEDTLGQLLRKIAKQAPQDVKGRYFLANLLEQVDRYTEKSELCKLVLSALQDRSAGLLRKKAKRKLACDKRCIYTKAANETRVNSALTAEQNSSDVLKEICQQVYYSHIKPRPVRTGKRSRNSGDPAAGDPSNGSSSTAQLLAARRRKHAARLKAAAAADSANSTDNLDEVSPAASQAAVSLARSRASRARHSCSQHHVTLPPLAVRYGHNVVEDWVSAPVHLRMSVPRPHSVDLMSMGARQHRRAVSAAELSTGNNLLYDAADSSAIATSAVQHSKAAAAAQNSDDDGCSSVCSVQSHGSAAPSLSSIGSLRSLTQQQQQQQSLHSSMTATTTPAAAASARASACLRSVGARQVNKQTQRLLDSMAKHNPHAAMIRRSDAPQTSSSSSSSRARSSRVQAAPAIYHTGGAMGLRSVTGAASQWRSGVNLSALHLREERRASDYAGRLQAAFHSSLDVPYAARIDSEMLLHDAAAAHARAASGHSSTTTLNTAASTTTATTKAAQLPSREEICRGWELLADGVLARHILVAVAAHARKQPPVGELASSDLLPEPLFVCLLATECFRPPVPQQLMGEWCELLLSDLKAHIKSACSKLKQYGIVSAGGFFSRLCSDSNYFEGSF